MKIATFNINGINRRLSNLLVWLEATRPDIVCLQELKAEHTAFPETQIAARGYDSVWVGQRSWNGVAILSRIGQPILTRRGLPDDPSDQQARYIEAAVAGVLVASIYAPNGNPQPGAKFDYKLAWMARLHRRATALRKTGAPIVLAGDFNVAPTDLDIYPTRSWDNDALVHPQVVQHSSASLDGHGPTRCGNFIRASGSTPSGITNVCDGNVMLACVSTICWSAPIFARGWQERASTVRSEDLKAPVIMHQPGSPWRTS